VVIRATEIGAAKRLNDAPDLEQALRELLAVMETPRSRKASVAWDAACAVLNKAGVVSTTPGG
jgi:hypothetical protein